MTSQGGTGSRARFPAGWRRRSPRRTCWQRRAGRAGETAVAVRTRGDQTRPRRGQEGRGVAGSREERGPSPDQGPRVASSAMGAQRGAGLHASQACRAEGQVCV